MRKLLLSASALCALAATAGTASAADLARPVYRPPPAVVPVCETCNWSGFYIGFNVGESKDWTTTTETWSWFQNFPGGTIAGSTGPAATLFTTGPVTSTLSDQYRHASAGFLGGVQWGYNWQIGHVVLGLEGDWNWTNEKDTVTYSAQPISTLGPISPGNITAVNGTTAGWTSEEKIDWLTTWRARLGWAHDCYMWYVTGGVAWAKVENNYTLFSTPGSTGVPSTALAGAFVGGNWGLPGGGAFGNFSTTKVGWVLGGGVETSIGRLFGWGNNNWSLKLEYLYVDLGTTNNTIGTTLTPVGVLVTPNGVAIAPGTATGSTSFFSQNHVYEQIVRVGLNYRFNYGLFR